MKVRKSSKKYTNEAIIQRINAEYCDVSSSADNILSIAPFVLVLLFSIVITLLVYQPCDTCKDTKQNDEVIEEYGSDITAENDEELSGVIKSNNINSDEEYCGSCLSMMEFNIPETLRDTEQTIVESDEMRTIQIEDNEGNIVCNINIPTDANTNVYVNGIRYDLESVISDWMKIFCDSTYNSEILARIGMKNITQATVKLGYTSCSATMNNIEKFCATECKSIEDKKDTANYLRNIYTNAYRKLNGYYYSDTLVDIIRDSGYSYASYYIDSIEELDFDTLVFYASEHNSTNFIVGYKVVLKHFSFVYEDEFDTELILLGVTDRSGTVVKFNVYDFAPANLIMLEEGDYNDILLMNSYEDTIVDDNSSNENIRSRSIMKL